MAISSAQVSCTSTATEIARTDSIAGLNSITLKTPTAIRVINQDAAVSVFLGGPGVTTANGYELKPGASIPVELDGDDILYGRTTAATVRVDVLKQSA